MTDDDLVLQARAARARSYAPYSSFRAGAAVRDADGRVHVGVIVENVSLGLTMCAERVALHACIAAGGRPVRLALVAPATDGATTWPCGACVQVARELGGAAMEVVVGRVDTDAPVEEAVVGELLPRGPGRGRPAADAGRGSR